MLSIADIEKIATRAAASKMFRGPTKDPLTVDQAFMVMLRGAELGLPATTALTGMWFVSGKPVLEASTINVLLAQGGYTGIVDTLTDEQCVMHLQRDGQALPATQTTFTYAEAKKAGLASRGQNWDTWRQDMLFARCLSRLARRHAPGIFGGGVYVPGEIEDESPAPVRAPVPDMTGERARWEACLAEIYAVATAKGYRREQVASFLEKGAAALQYDTLDQVTPATLQRWLEGVRGWPEKPGEAQGKPCALCAEAPATLTCANTACAAAVCAGCLVEGVCAVCADAAAMQPEVPADGVPF